MKYSFRNDYNQIGHPRIIQTLIQHANDVQVGYGFDEVTINLEQKVCDILSEKVRIFLMAGGTQTNLVVLSKMLNPYEAVVAVAGGHINVHETGAVEGTGHKIITTEGICGKITVNEILDLLKIYNEPHRVMIKAVYISNSTEIGTIYNKEELKAIYEVCKNNHLYLFLDGARLPVALTSKGNDLTIQDICKYTDAFYLGGTKNGLPLGEMLIIKNEDISRNFEYHLKNRGAMFAKTFVLSYMFDKYLENDFYLELAKNTNLAADYLRSELKKINVQIVYPNETNQIFIELDNSVVEQLQAICDFEIWEKTERKTIIRLVTCFNTTIEECHNFISDLEKLLK